MIRHIYFTDLELLWQSCKTVRTHWNLNTGDQRPKLRTLISHYVLKYSNMKNVSLECVESKAKEDILSPTSKRLLKSFSRFDGPEKFFDYIYETGAVGFGSFGTTRTSRYLSVFVNVYAIPWKSEMKSWYSYAMVRSPSLMPVNIYFQSIYLHECMCMCVYVRAYLYVYSHVYIWYVFVYVHICEVSMCLWYAYAFMHTNYIYVLK